MRHRHAELGEQSRQHHALGIGKDPPQGQGAGGGVEADAGEVQVAFVGIVLLIGETEIQGDVLANDQASTDSLVSRVMSRRSRSFMVK